MQVLTDTDRHSGYSCGEWRKTNVDGFCLFFKFRSIRLFVFFCWQLLNKTTEFEAAVRRVLSDVRLDNDIVVSVFETNIRVLG